MLYAIQQLLHAELRPDGKLGPEWWQHTLDYDDEAAAEYERYTIEQRLAKGP